MRRSSRRSKKTPIPQNEIGGMNYHPQPNQVNGQRVMRTDYMNNPNPQHFQQGGVRLQQGVVQPPSSNVPKVEQNEFFREHRNMEVDLSAIKKRLDEELSTDENRTYFWNCFRSFIEGQISKSEFSRSIQQKSNEKILKLFNYFVRGLLHNSRLSRSVKDGGRKDFDEFFDGIKPSTENPFDHFGTLVHTGLIDFSRFSIGENVVSCFGKKYGEVSIRPPNYVSASTISSHLSSTDDLSKLHKLNNGFGLGEVKIMNNRLKHFLPPEMGIGSNVSIVLLLSTEIFLKNVIARMIQRKKIQKETIRYDTSTRYLDPFPIYSPFINSVPSMEIPGAIHNYFYYKDDIEESVQKKEEGSLNFLLTRKVREKRMKEFKKMNENSSSSLAQKKKQKGQKLKYENFQFFEQKENLFPVFMKDEDEDEDEDEQEKQEQEQEKKKRMMNDEDEEDDEEEKDDDEYFHRNDPLMSQPNYLFSFNGWLEKEEEAVQKEIKMQKKRGKFRSILKHRKKNHRRHKEKKESKESKESKEEESYEKSDVFITPRDLLSVLVFEENDILIPNLQKYKELILSKDFDLI